LAEQRIYTPKNTDGRARRGEVGLSGEVRAVTNIDRRVTEAAKLGFKTVVLPQGNLAQVTDVSVELIGVKDIQTALDRIIG